MLKVQIVLILFVLVLLTVTSAPADAEKRPLVVAHYYTWYTTDYGPHQSWGHWGHPGPSTFYPNGCSPERILFAPSIRQISSCAYPLIGPYDSDCQEVVRWHIRLAKAAGIDAFTVDWWGDAHWQNPSGWTRHVFEDVVLPVAEEEGFKVCLFDETLEFYEPLQQAMEWTIKYLNRYKNSPAYLHIDGQPVYVVYQRWDGRLKLEEGRQLIESVEKEVGDVYWIIDKIIARSEKDDESDLLLKVIPGWESLDRLDAISTYATFSSFRKFDRAILQKLYTDIAADIHRSGKKVLLPVHPGMDNRKIQIDEVANAQGLPHWWIPRREGVTLKDYLSAVTESGADFIAVTSFNEWPETTVVEPALTWPDPYSYLKIIAEYQGIQWKAPPIPASDELDPVMAHFLKHSNSSSSENE